MKKIISLLLVFNIILLNGCSSSNTTVNNVTNKFKEIDKYIFEVDEYTALDYDFADAFFAEINDNWEDEGGCSAISKMVDGHRLIGRNMDLNITNKCSYIIRTNVGKYKTMGITYTHRDYSPDYEDIKANGFDESFYKILPFMCDDVMNDEGLHVEVNMRHGECWPNGEDKFACPGTNPDSKDRVYMFELSHYIAENCATVDEAKEYINTLDIYSQNNYWNYCFIVSDSKGDSSLLEFSDNEIIWLDEDKIDSYKWLKEYKTKAIGQTNFYLNEDAWNVQEYKIGVGRFIELQKGINKVKSRSDMYDLIRKVQYNNYYLGYDECKDKYFDPLTELAGEASFSTYDFVIDPENEALCKSILDGLRDTYASMSRQEIQDANEYWGSIFTEVVDTNTKEIFVRFYEKEDSLYLISFDGTTKLNSITDWK